MTTAVQKIVRCLKINEISSVDRPAQVGAVSVLMKRLGEEDMSTTDIRKNAAAVATGGEPAFTVTQYEDALRGPVPSHTARHQATRAQAAALGFAQMVAELPA